MKCDFLIFYEHASREMETDCYLAALLEQRGYRVKIINRRYLWRVFLNPKVIITPFLYGDKDVHEFTGFLSGRKRAIIDLQYEQIYNDARLQSDFSKPSVLASLATHICWGRSTRERLLEAGVNGNLLPVTGAISMDFNRPSMRSFLKNKEQLAHEFNIDDRKPWHLFISSFVHGSLNKSALEGLERKIPGYLPFVNVSLESQRVIVSWLKQMAKKHPEIVFIYRPHPNEHDTDIIKDIVNTSENIKVIPYYSIRQWVAVCETSSNWFSTSIADCFFAERSSCVLRPIPIPEKFEVKVLEGCEMLHTVEEYDKFLSCPPQKYTPLNLNVFSGLYLTNTDVLFGDLVANACEEVIKGRNFPFERGWRDCIRAFKYDLMASVFRVLPSLGKDENSRFHEFQVMAQGTKNDRQIMKGYFKIFNSFMRNGR